MRAVLVGGSGFLGAQVRRHLLERGDEVTVIGRGAESDAVWDGRTLGPWSAALDGADVIVHLAGKRVDCRPTRANIDELISSREGTVNLVGAALARVERPPQHWVQLSSLAIFGDTGDEVVDESTTPSGRGPRQMVEVCRRWEAAYESATAGVTRRVLLRPAIGIGGPGDPATRRLVLLARLGLAGPVAGGRQWVSWIGGDDLLTLLVRAIDDPHMTGLYHLTSPTPVRNDELMAAYREAVGARFGVASPAAVTRLGAWLLGSDPELALTGRRAVPTRLLDEGFRFRQTDIADVVARAVVASG